MVPVFIGVQVRRALRIAAEDSALSDIAKMKLMDCIMEKLQTEAVCKCEPQPVKSMTKGDLTLSIELAPEIAQTMVIREQGKRWSLIIRKESEENQTEFIFDTYRRIEITFG